MIDRFHKRHPNYIVDKLIYEGVKKALPFIKGNLLDIGCGDLPYFQLIKANVSRYIGLNFFHEEGNERNLACDYVVGRGEFIPLLDNSVDTVLCTEVLEHTAEPDLLIQEVKRVLKSKGYFIITVPQVWCLHHIPYDYRRYTRYGLEHLLKKFELKIITIEERGHFWLMAAQMLNYYVHYSFTAPPSRRISLTAIIYRLIRRMRSLIYVTSYFAGSFLDRFDKAKLDTLGYLVVAQKI